MRTPLAWANLTHDRVRFALFAAGVVFAVVLIFVQLGFRGALLDSQTLLHAHLNADLVILSPNRQALAMRETFPRRRLAQAAAVPGVARADALFVDNGFGILRDADRSPARRSPSRAIRVVGIDPDRDQLDLPGLTPEVRDRLKLPGTALYDRLSPDDDRRSDINLFGLPGDPGPGDAGLLETPVETELSGRRVRFVGWFSLGPDFTTDGAMLISAETFADLLRRPVALGAPLADVDLGLVSLEPGADRDAVRAALLAALNPGTRPEDGDVAVLTRAEYVAQEQEFWLANTPIGFVFDFGMAMGFAVGLVICYQILSGDVADHLAEYATLKALGHSNRALAGVVVQESLILAAVGYAAGLAVSLGVYELLSGYTGMPLNLSWERAAIVLAVTALMCVASALLALGKLLRADPADVF